MSNAALLQVSREATDNNSFGVLGGLLHRNLVVGPTNDPLEKEADRIAGYVVTLGTPVNMKRVSPRIQCFSKKLTHPSVEAAIGVESLLSGPGAPLEPSLRKEMEVRFGHNFSDVRVHTGACADRSVVALNASAYTIGDHIVFGSGRYAPQTRDGLRLIAHELTHVLQQSVVSKKHNPLNADSSMEMLTDRMSTRPCMNFAALQMMSDGGIRIARAPGSGKSVPAVVNYAESALPGGRIKLRAFGVVGDKIARPGLERKYPLPSKIGLPSYDRWHFVGPDAIGAEHGIVYSPRRFNISETAVVENQIRNARSAVRANGGQVFFDFYAECDVLGDFEGVQIRILRKVRWIVNVRPAGSDSLLSVINRTESVPAAPISSVVKQSSSQSRSGPPSSKRAGTPPGSRQTRSSVKASSAASTKQRNPRPAMPPRQKPNVYKKPGSPTTPKGSGLASGLLGFVAPIVAAYVHQRAVEERIEEQSHEQGYVPYGAPSGQGVLYDFGAWLIDPFNEADKSVGVYERFDVRVWRDRIRQIAENTAVGQTFTITWDVGRCERDIFGHQVILKVEVTYLNTDKGAWEASPKFPVLPNIHSILSRDVSDDQLLAMLMRNPCEA